MPRFAWLVLLAPLACFSEGDVDGSGGESSQGGSESPSTTAVSDTAPPTTTAATTDGTQSGPDPDSGEVTGMPTSSATTTTSDESESGETDATTDSGDACMDGFVEIPALPVGWVGVFMLSPPPLGEELAQCPPASNDVDVVIEDPVTTSCTCDCDPACWYNADLDGACSNPDEILDPVYDESCTDVPAGPMHIAYDLVDLGDNGGCGSPVATPVTEGTQRRICEHTDGTPCVPKPAAFLAPCVRHEGDLACPAGPYSLAVHTVEAVDAACVACESCIPAAFDACHNAEASLFSLPGCMGDESPVTDLSCSPETGASLFLDFELECPASDAMLQALFGEYTYCCVP